MISDDDIRSAVGSGLLSEAQAASLVSLSQARLEKRENLASEDEPFELFKGFNEIFIVVGLSILASGWYGVNAIAGLADTSGLHLQTIFATAVAALVLWLLSNYFVSHRRMVAPAIALSVMFAANAYVGFSGLASGLLSQSQGSFGENLASLFMTVLAMVAYWWRFRVPFAIAQVALGIFGLSMLFAAQQTGQFDSMKQMFLLGGKGPFALITLLLGLIGFAVAMRFDMSDPHRVTRRSAQGFWLHVIAAPALINTIALSLLEQNTAFSQLLLLIWMLAFALVAIVIDRRSFLIAAIGYVVILSFTIFNGQGAAWIILLLGVFLVGLGAMWAQIRASLLRNFFGWLPLHRLPPSY